MSQEKLLPVSRRGLFRKAGALGLTALAAGVMTAAPRKAEAAVDALVAEKMGAGSVTIGKVQAALPETAENGALVRVPVTVDHPMDADNYIESVGIFVDNNPKPLVGVFSFTPACGKADFEVRMKMAKPSDVRIIARTNKGVLFGYVQKVNVAEGGCAG